MVEYIYFVKCPNCEDEHFSFFNDAKEHALCCLSQQPIITQVEVNRNDFGECVDSCDLGTVWSWRDMMKDTEEDPAISIFTKDDLVTHGEYDPDSDPEFTELDNSLDFIPDNFKKPMSEDFDHTQAAAKCSRNCYDFYKAIASKAPQKEIKKYGKVASKFVKDQYGLTGDEAEELLWDGYIIWKQLNETKKPVPPGMTIEQLVEEMEENEDTVECKWCNELFDKSECRYEVDLGYLCPRCEAAIKSRGETLTFRESLTSTFNPDELVDLEYKNVAAEVITDVIPATYWEPEDYKAKTVTKDFIYEVPAEEVATFIYEDLLEEEDIKDVPGGFDTLENDDAWQEFLNTHFDILLKKYYQKILDHFEEDAYEAAEEQFQKEYDDYAYDMKWGL